MKICYNHNIKNIENELPVLWISLNPVVFTSYRLIILATQMFSVQHRGKVVVRIISFIKLLYYLQQ